ncbi:hypothetical protein [Frigoriglobus tundricola]|uniref:Uncharacterized protein n=1 Tax=Frigoriglobus tundricola TaxID=2774151 RepID=A0A6M5YS86_9BACT|nr:hypothetical protein [Frigoriglobus tundricola]QJW96300.1 hypothetical protein FTUN_3857 [Frigoriglobus tundricola]
MTDVEWDTADDPLLLLGAMGERASERKLGLFGLFCCRQVWDMVAGPAPHEVLDAAEIYADGLLTESERYLAELEALDALERELEREDEFGLPMTDVVQLIAKSTYIAGDAVGIAGYVTVLARYGARVSLHGIFDDLRAEQCLARSRRVRAARSLAYNRGGTRRRGHGSPVLKHQNAQRRNRNSRR